jgi:hypothetical protein
MLRLTLVAMATMAVACAGFGPAPHPHKDWRVPLFLYTSDVNKDTALLAVPPSTYATVTASDTYRLVYAEPVAYAAAVASAASNANVALCAYWSAEYVRSHTHVQHRSMHSFSHVCWLVRVPDGVLTGVLPGFPT